MVPYLRAPQVSARPRLRSTFTHHSLSRRSLCTPHAQRCANRWDAKGGGRSPGSQNTAELPPTHVPLRSPAPVHSRGGSSLRSRRPCARLLWSSASLHVDLGSSGTFRAGERRQAHSSRPLSSVVGLPAPFQSPGQFCTFPGHLVLVCSSTCSSW